MKIFDLEFLILSSVRKFRARIRKAFQKKQLSGYLILRYLSIFVIAFNIFISPSPTSGKPKNSQTGVGAVLSQETKLQTPKIKPPQRVPGSTDFDAFLGKSALILDATTSAVLYEKNSQEKLAPASLTKMMTTLVVLDYRKISDEVKVSENCTKSDGAKVGFTKDQNFTVESLLYALLLPSASDAACALSETLPLPGPEASPSARFVVAMNKKAEQNKRNRLYSFPEKNQKAKTKEETKNRAPKKANNSIYPPRMHLSRPFVFMLIKTFSPVKCG